MSQLAAMTFAPQTLDIPRADLDRVVASALAEDLGGRWLTADEKAARRVGSRLAMRLATWKSPR